MNWFIKAVTSSIGKKFLMGLTGLALWLYLVLHLIGNLIVYGGPQAFNGYAHMLESNKILLYGFELLLATAFLVHVVLSIIVTVENRAARPVAYAKLESKEGRTLASKTMIYTGVILFVFLIIHLKNLKLAVPEGANGMRDLYSAEIALFHNGLYSLFYILGMCIVALHVSHGLQSAFRSLGVNHPKYTAAIEWISRAAAIVFLVGFSSIPIWVYFFKGGAP